MTTGAFKIADQRVACVIPAYNSASTICRALTSVCAAPGIAEIIVVDDGSTDQTSSLVRNFASHSPLTVRLIMQPNGGAASARNAAISEVGNEVDWITFLDSDDEMLPAAVVSKLDHLSRCLTPESVDAVYGSFVRGDTGRTAEFAETRTTVDRDDIGRIGGFPGGVVSFIFRREAVQSAGGLRTELTMYEDFELILRMISNGARVVGCAVPGFYRHYRPGSLTRGANLQTRLRIERQFLSIASAHRLLSTSEIVRRLFRNQVRRSFNLVTGR